MPPQPWQGMKQRSEFFLKREKKVCAGDERKLKMLSMNKGREIWRMKYLCLKMFDKIQYK